MKNSYRKRLDYNNSYNRKTYRSFSIRLDRKKEARYISLLEKKPSVKEYLLSLIEEDAAKKKATKKSRQ